MPSVNTPDPACQDPLPDIFPYGGIALLAGAPNVGKTAFLAGLLRDLRDGRPALGVQPNPIPAIGYISMDRGWMRGAGFWFDKVGYPEIRHYCMADDRTFVKRRLRKKFERTDILATFIDKLNLPPYSLVAVDPIGIFLGGNLLDYDACYCACCEIREYLEKQSYSLVGNAHSGKLKGDKKERYVRMTDQILGSTAISGATDTMLYLAGPHETGRNYHTLVCHPHTAKQTTFNLQQDDQGVFSIYTGADGSNQSRVLALLPAAGTSVTFGDLVTAAQQYPLSRRTVKNALDDLLAVGKAERVGHGAYQRVVLQ